MVFVPRKPDPHNPEDRFCVYCQRQYERFGDFRRHVVEEHGVGLAKRLGLVPLDPGETIPF